MLLKTGVVYRHKNQYLLVLGHRVFKRRRIYTVQKISRKGSIRVKPFEIRYESDGFEATKIIARVEAEIPKTDFDTQKFYYNLKECRAMLQDFAVSGQNKEDVDTIAIKILGLVGLYDGKAKVQADLRYIAIRLGVKRPTKLYRILRTHYEGFVTEGRRVAISKASDETLVKSYNSYRETWKFVHGFSKGIDELLERDLGFYIAEMRERNL